jgi:heme A synthase
MKAGPLLFRVTAGVVFLQLLLGGLLTFNFISAAPHIVTGFIVFILAIATMVVALVSKPSFRPMQGMSVGLVVLILVQIILGFATLDSGSQVIAWIHFVNAMLIYGLAVSGTVTAIRWDHMARGQASPVAGTEHPEMKK